ncbi:MAG: hypothetical protein C4519_00350 [Desulfobacteraceae bacterium]|nr:MAG: hypothetical protein C4519_00350 [Desulfobacteraceae bacterium]
MRFRPTGLSGLGGNLLQAVAAWRANQEAQNELMTRLGLPLMMDMRQKELDRQAEDRREQMRTQREDANKRWEYKKAIDITALEQDREDARKQKEWEHEERLERIRASAKGGDKAASPAEVRGQVETMIRGNALPEASVKTRQEQQAARERVGIVDQLYPAAGADKAEAKRLKALRQDIVDHPEKYPEEGKFAGLLERFPDAPPPRGEAYRFTGYDPFKLSLALGDSANNADFTMPLINQIYQQNTTDQSLPVYAGVIQDEITRQNQVLQSDPYKDAIRYLVNTGADPLQAAMLVQHRGIKDTMQLIKEDIRARAGQVSGAMTAQQYSQMAEALEEENQKLESMTEPGRQGMRRYGELKTEMPVW